MTMYANASLRLLDNMEQASSAGRAYEERGYEAASTTNSTALPHPSETNQSDVSRINLLQSLTEYTNSRVTVASFGSFPPTPFSDSNSIAHSISSGLTAVYQKSPRDRRWSKNSVTSRPSRTSVGWVHLTDEIQNLNYKFNLPSFRLMSSENLNYLFNF